LLRRSGCRKKSTYRRIHRPNIDGSGWRDAGEAVRGLEEEQGRGWASFDLAIFRTKMQISFCSAVPHQKYELNDNFIHYSYLGYRRALALAARRL
jgi:hypothetical protein